MIAISGSNYPIINGVAIPVDLERFIAPDLEEALKYYPSYLRHGGTQPIQPYLLCVVKAYAWHERDRHGNRVDEDDILQQFFRHVGLPAVFELFQQGMNAFAAQKSVGGPRTGQAVVYLLAILACLGIAGAYAYAVYEGWLR